MDVLNALVVFANFVFLPGLAYGAQLALGALGITLVFGILRFSNFAHGDLMAFGTMITILVTWWLIGMGVTLGPLPTALLALPIGIIGAVIMALIIDRSVFRFYRQQRSASIVLVMASVGVMCRVVPPVPGSRRARGQSRMFKSFFFEQCFPKQ